MAHDEKDPDSQKSRFWPALTALIVTSLTGLAGWAFFLVPKKSAEEAKVISHAQRTGELKHNAMDLAGLKYLPSHSEADTYHKYEAALKKAVGNLRRSVTIHAVDKIEVGAIAVGAGLGAAWLVSKFTAKPADDVASAKPTEVQRLHLNDLRTALNDRPQARSLD